MRFLRKVFGKAKAAKTLEDAAFGCILGACACAPHEMLGRKPDEEEVERALTMPGGGKLKVAPGQITDDGEMTLCLAQGLADSGSLQLEPVARRYAYWVRSRPFDMGFTIRRSLACFHEDFAFFAEGPPMAAPLARTRLQRGHAQQGCVGIQFRFQGQRQPDARGGRQVPCRPHAGFVKIAFTPAGFYSAQAIAGPGSVPGWVG